MKDDIPPESGFGMLPIQSYHGGPKPIQIKSQPIGRSRSLMISSRRKSSVYLQIGPRSSPHMNTLARVSAHYQSSSFNFDIGKARNVKSSILIKQSVKPHKKREDKRQERKVDIKISDV